MGHRIFWMTLTLWLVTDFSLLLLRRQGGNHTESERSSKYVMAALIFAGMFSGILLFPESKKYFLIPFTPLRYASIVLMLMGAAIRLLAAYQLGPSFSRNVGTGKGAPLMKTGLYSQIRHPGYLGEMLVFSGIAVAFNHPVSSGLAFLMPLAAFLYRMNVEEKALMRAYGSEYSEYAARTKRIAPFLY